MAHQYSNNFDELAYVVGKDIKAIKEDSELKDREIQERLDSLESRPRVNPETLVTKAELEEKNYIEGKSDYQILKHQVEFLVKQNQTLQEQLALVKPAPRRAPMAYTIDLNSSPPVAWFDNGCGLDVGGSLTFLGKNKNKSWDQMLPNWDFPNAILRTSLAIIDIEVWKKSDFTYWSDNIKVLNPIKSADDYDWTNARLSEKGNVDAWRWNNQKNVIRVMYQLGIWNAKTVESLGAVRR